jgi:hypothetical protein
VGACSRGFPRPRLASSSLTTFLSTYLAYDSCIAPAHGMLPSAVHVRSTTHSHNLHQFEKMPWDVPHPVESGDPDHAQAVVLLVGACRTTRIARVCVRACVRACQSVCVYTLERGVCTHVCVRVCCRMHARCTAGFSILRRANLWRGTGQLMWYGTDQPSVCCARWQAWGKDSAAMKVWVTERAGYISAGLWCCSFKCWCVPPS